MGSARLMFAAADFTIIKTIFNHCIQLIESGFIQSPCWSNIVDAAEIRLRIVDKQVELWQRQRVIVAIEKLNILILHRMGDPKYWRSAVRDLEFMLPTYASEHNYIVHDGDMPLPEFIKDIDFHGIVLGPTFLCNRYYPKAYAKVRKKYDFIRTSSAVKIALPQDDYDCSAIFDRWMVDWEVDLVYSVCPDNWSVLYPKYSATDQIKLGYTGYVSDYLVDTWREPKAFDTRSIDVSYRASKLSPNFGRLGYIKGAIGDCFKLEACDTELKLDISNDAKDMIPGDRWHAFLEDSKFCLVTNSGSSLFDPEGEFRTKVYRYLLRYPNASFEEVERTCFPGEDGKYIFTAISPRNIEAALAKTVQIATTGSYSNILHPEEHYIPIETDCSDISNVLDKMKDRNKVRMIAENCREAILSVDSLRYKNFVASLIEQILDGAFSKGNGFTNNDRMMNLKKSYHDRVGNTNMYWSKRRAMKKAYGLAVSLGARRLKHFIVDNRVFSK